MTGGQWLTGRGMSILTYVRKDIACCLYVGDRQAAGVVARRGEDAAVLGRGTAGSRCVAATPAGRRKAGDAPLAPDASGWFAVPRIADCRCRSDLAPGVSPGCGRSGDCGCVSENDTT